ncbi:MAG: hypothetical protein ABTA16_04340 [Niallia sp.]
MEEKRTMYVELIFGSIGMIIIALFIVNALYSDSSSMAILPLILGFGLMNGYIFFLEKKAGFSKQVIWTQSLILFLFFIIYLMFKFYY